MAQPPKKEGRPKDLTTEDRRIWARVTGSVTPPKSRKAARITQGLSASAALPADVLDPKPLKATSKLPPRPLPRPTSGPAPVAPPTPVPLGARPAPGELEPRRQRRLSRERDPIEATLDLHGFGRFEAEDQLRAFLSGCQARGLRAVLVITGQGRRLSQGGGGGVIRASVHEWLHAPALRGVVSGFASAHRRHGGDGAIYVTLKKR
ncbi:Smr/MutS family protein [soil metagenome]